MTTYNDLIETLKECLNTTKRDNLKYTRFGLALRELKNSYNISLSSDFLKDLINGTTKQKTDKLSKFLKFGEFNHFQKIEILKKEKPTLLKSGIVVYSPTCRNTYKIEYKHNKRTEYKVLSIEDYMTNRESLNAVDWFAYSVANGESVTLYRTQDKMVDNHIKKMDSLRALSKNAKYKQECYKILQI